MHMFHQQPSGISDLRLRNTQTQCRYYPGLDSSCGSDKLSPMCTLSRAFLLTSPKLPSPNLVSERESFALPSCYRTYRASPTTEHHNMPRRHRLCVKQLRTKADGRILGWWNCAPRIEEQVAGRYSLAAPTGCVLHGIYVSWVL